MKIGKLVSLEGNRIPISPDIAPFLGLRHDCQLHMIYKVIPLEFNSLIEISFSTIPFNKWPLAYQTNIDLCHVHGSQLECMKIFEKHKANILISESVCSPSINWGVISVVFEFEETSREQKSLLGTRQKKLDERAERLYQEFKTISEKRREKFGIEILDRPSKLRELCQLYNIAKKEGLEPYTTKLVGRSLFLPEDVFTTKGPFAIKPSSQALLSTDTEERVANIIILPSQENLIHIHLDTDWENKDRLPIGAYRRILEILLNYNVNIFRSFNYLLEKNYKKERSRIRFIGHAPNLVGKEELQSALKQKLKALSLDNNISLGVTEVEILEATTRVPLCFIARPTNESRSKKFNILKSRLENLGLKVITGRVTGRKGVRNYIRDLIFQCVCVVSLWTREEKRRLAHVRRGNVYAPSEWLIFEQEVAHAAGIPVFQLIEEGVTQDPVYYGYDFILFKSDDEKSFKDAVKDLNERVEQWIDSEDFLKALARVARYKACFS